MSIYEYDEERHMRQTREEGMEEGYANGLSQGIIQTAVNMLKLKEFDGYSNSRSYRTCSGAVG